MTEEKLYNKLSADYDKLFVENIIQFQRKSLKQQNAVKKYVDLYPMFGIKKDEICDFLVYGQALNGWSVGFNISENKLEI